MSDLTRKQQHADASVVPFDVPHLDSQRVDPGRFENFHDGLLARLAHDLPEEIPVRRLPFVAPLAQLGLEQTLGVDLSDVEVPEVLIGLYLDLGVDIPHLDLDGNGRATEDAVAN